MRTQTGKIIAGISVLVVFFAMAVWIAWGNTALQCNTYTVKSESLPKAFDGFRILQVSDVHNAEIWMKNNKLLPIMKKAEADIIAITGDLVDSEKTDLVITLSFIEEAVKIAPCYFVTGNHENKIARFDYLVEEMEKVGVTVLRDERVKIVRDGESISLIGLDDPHFKTDYLFEKEAENTNRRIKTLIKDGEFTVLLSHRPELFEVYCENEVDLVFTGHAHGGQFRLPFVGGLYAPHQGILPKYYSGVYTENSTTMIVSRGVGNSTFPFRLNNRPEIIVAELKTEN